jgi:hypothetical protein
MIFQPSILGPVELPCPEPLRRPDHGAAKRAGVRLVRPTGLPHPSLAIRPWSEWSNR